MITIDALFDNEKFKKFLYAPLKFRLIGLIGIAIVSLFLSYNYFVQPEINNIQIIKDEIKNYDSQIYLAIKKEKNTEALKEQLVILEENNQEKRVSFPERLSIPTVLSNLESAFATTGVKINNISHIGTIKDTYLDVYGITFRASLTGSYESMIKIFVSLIDMKMITVISAIDLKKNNDGTLLMNIDIKTYSQQGV